MVDLTKTDVYPGTVVPDEDVEICLKVLRSIRGHCIRPAMSDADGAVMLGHAHDCVVELVEKAQGGTR